MEWLYNLFMSNSVAHVVFTLALVITLGVMLSRIKIAGISFGVTWILFVGIAAGHFGMTIEHETLHFIKEFGLILFVFSIGLQVGPGFFSSFKEGGVKMVGCAATVVLLGCLTTYIIHLVTGTPLPTMVGVMSGAVTNTPGLGAAQQAYADATGITDPTIALGYAVAYPLGVVGIILSLIAVRFITRVNFKEEDKALEAMKSEHSNVMRLSVEFTNGALENQSVAHIRDLINRSFVIARIMDHNGVIRIADGTSTLKVGDKIRVVCSPDDREAVIAFFGQEIEMTKEEWGVTSDNQR